jgi:type III restriction enzyme
MEGAAPVQTELAGIAEQVDVATVVAKTAELVVQKTIDIPRILVVPRGEVTSGFHPFTLDASSIHYQPVERDMNPRKIAQRFLKCILQQVGGLPRRRGEQN